MQIISNLLTALFSFYTHNGPVVFYSIGAGLTIAHLLRRPSRRMVLLFLGFLILVFSFEYQKHFVTHFNSHLVLQVVDPETHTEGYSLATRFTQQILPVAMDIVGWGILFVSMFTPFRGPGKTHS